MVRCLLLGVGSFHLRSRSGVRTRMHILASFSILLINRNRAGNIFLLIRYFVAC